LFDVGTTTAKTIFVELHLFSLKTVQKQGPLEAMAQIITVLINFCQDSKHTY
jgi:hypothetical protein